MWCDIVDFTRLANALGNTGQHGVERLHAVLSAHYDALLNRIAHHGGEPQIFVGDAVMVAWPCQSGTASQAVSRALTCASSIVASSPQSGDSQLPMHVHVSYGRLELLDLGDGARRHYVPIGDAVQDLHSITHVRAAGNVVVSTRAAQLIGLAADGAAALVMPTRGMELADSASPVSTAPAIEPIASSLEPWLPLPVTAWLDDPQLAWVAELRPVTVVFLRLANLDHLAADAAERFGELVAAVHEPLEQHEAVLSQIVVDEKGPSLLVYVGVPPRAHSDDPVRGIRLAFDLLSALTARSVHAQIGVTTGRGYCGIVGNDLRRHYTVLSNHVNLGARLMLLATVDSVLCDDETQRAACGELDFEPCGQLRVKGYDQPVPVWRPLRVCAVPHRARLVGRETELLALTEIPLRRRAEGAAVAVVGEVGIGKTLLLDALRERLGTQGCRVLHGAASRVAQDSPYFCWRPVFAQLLDCGAAEPTEQRERILAQLPPELSEQAALLNVLLPCDFPESPTLQSLSGTQRRDATRALFKGLLARAADDGNLLVTLEDTHLCDAASWQLIQDICSEPAGIFLVLTSRPASQRLGTLVGARRMELQGLDRGGVAALLSECLGAAQWGSDLQDWIMRRSGGHPFVVTALLRVLQERGTLQLIDGAALVDVASLDALELPHTIRGLITRRLDGLAPGPKLTLKVAAVLGKEFPAELLEKVHPLEAQRGTIATHLAALTDRGLIHPANDNGATHVFQHDLVREVAYGLLPHRHRCELHRLTADWYESQFGTHSPLHFATLAYHYEQAGAITRAVDYLELEAMRAFSAGLAGESVDLGRRAADLLGLDLPTDALHIQARIGTDLAEIATLLAERTPSQLLDLPALQDTRVERLIELLLRIGPLAFQSHRIELFALMAATALQLTLQHGNGPVSADVYSMYSVVHRSLTGDCIGGYRWSQLALELDQRAQGRLRGRVGFVHTWFHHHWAHPLRESCAIALDAAEAAFAAGDVLFGCFNLSGQVIYLAASGAPLAEVMQCAHAALDRNGGRVMNAAFHLIHELQVAKALAGLTTTPLCLSDAQYDETRDLASICNTELSNQIGYYFVSRVKLHAHAGDWTGALEWAHKATDLLPAFAGQVAEMELVYFHAIAALQHAATFEAGEASAWLASGKQHTERLRTWAQLVDGTQRSPDFEHRALLLEAELAAAHGELRAFDYEAAAARAVEHSYWNDAGLAHELLSRRLWMHGETQAARAAAARASDAYRRWGAMAKVELCSQLSESPAAPQLRIGVHLATHAE